MTASKALITRHPVPVYFALTFAISWGATLLVIGGPGRIPATPEEIPRLFPAVYLATVAGPSLGGARRAAQPPIPRMGRSTSAAPASSMWWRGAFRARAPRTASSLGRRV